MKVFDDLKSWWRGLPDKKRYIELVSAALTVPVLITVILLNLGNLKGKEQNKPQTPTQNERVIVITPQGKEDEKNQPTPQKTQEQCIKEVGPVEITTPKEDEVIGQSPVQFNISYKDERYCSVVWAWRMDNGPWSEFLDKSISVYNLNVGAHKFELRVRSIASTDEIILVRNFFYQEKQEPSPTPTPTVTQ